MPMATQQTPYCPTSKGFKSEDDDSPELESSTLHLLSSLTLDSSSSQSPVFRPKSEDDESLEHESPTLRYFDVMSSLTFQDPSSLPRPDYASGQTYNVMAMFQPVTHAPKGFGQELGIFGPDPKLDRIEECGPYLLCIRPPDLILDPQDYYIIRLYHKDSKEIVIAVDPDGPPVKVYCAVNPNTSLHGTLFGMCWWWVSDKIPFYAMYNGRFVCRWGGERVVKQLPYERGQQSLM